MAEILDLAGRTIHLSSNMAHAFIGLTGDLRSQLRQCARLLRDLTRVAGAVVDVIDVLTLLAQGLSAKEIVFELNLSSKTVEMHRALLMKKLGLQDITALVRYAIRNKLISLD